MNIDRIKELKEETAYPKSRSVHQALLKVWKECQQEHSKQLIIADVSHQRELLISFAEYLKERNLINVRKENLAIRIDLFLKRN
jgi:hypothetical protein